MAFNSYKINDDNTQLDYIIPDAIKKNAVLLCEDPKAVRVYAEEHNMSEGLTLMSYQQMSNIVTFNRDIVIDNVQQFLKYLFPSVTITAWGV